MVGATVGRVYLPTVLLVNHLIVSLLSITLWMLYQVVLLVIQYFVCTVQELEL